MSQADILISGATGRTGGAAIDTLLGMGRRVRAYVRSDDERVAALRQRGVDIAVGDFTDIDGIRAAMEGISSAYFLYPIAPGIIGAAAYFAQAAKEAGVTAIVNMSQISARRESKSHAAQDHWISERVFDWSGVATTHLRPTFFADWLVYPHFAKEIWAKKKIEFPFENGRHAPISADDQGRVIAHILARPAGHEGKIYTLHGPVEMNQAEIAAAMSDVLGARIEYAPTSIEVFKQKMEQLYKFPPFLVQHLVEVAQRTIGRAFSLAPTMWSRRSPERQRYRSRLSSKNIGRPLPDERGASDIMKVVRD
jgi:NAD(P)H dehydrogenase (quinone)